MRFAFHKTLALTLALTTTAFLPIAAQGHGQQLSHLYHTAWTTRDGAPADILALAQTTDGFLWLGTLTGLFRFDGVRFELFDPAAPQSLPSVGVQSLLALPDGGLWVGYTFGGVSLIRGGAIQSFGERDGLPRATVRSLVRDSTGVIWAGTTRGVAGYENGTWHRVGPEEGIPSGQVMGMLADRGRLWVAAADGVFMRPYGAPRFQRAGLSYSAIVGYRQLITLQEGPDGVVWASSPEIGLRSVPSTAGAGSGRVFDSWGPALGPILVDRSGALWLGQARNGGIARIEAGGRSSERITQGLSSDLVWAWLEDREGNVWAGTTGGLDQFRHTKLTRVELPGATSFAIAPADSGALWVGSDERPLMRLGDQVRDFPEVRNPVDVAYGDREGVVWIGSPHGLWQLRRGRFAPVRLPAVENQGIQAVTRDGSGDLWISIVPSGVYRRIGERWVPFGGLASLPHEPAVVLTTDESGRTWFGYTGNRVARLEGDSVRLYTASDGLGVGIVLAIYARDQHAWVGGERGLALIAGGRVHPVAGRNGVQFRGTSGVVETPGGEVWLHGAEGITRIPAEEVRRAAEDTRYQVNYERLDFRDGLAGTAAQLRPQPTVIAGTDGRLWFATNAGIAWLDPKTIPRNPTPPRVIVRRLAAGNLAYPAGQELVLPVHTKGLRIDYTALSLSIPERVRFRYRLIGSDTGWQDAGGRREAFYTNLGPGSYRFQVAAANEDGVWNEDGATVNFTIPPSFTQTRWFLLAWIAALGVLIWLTYLARMRQVASRATAKVRERLTAQMEERERIARELHDTLLQGFQGITLKVQGVVKNMPDQDPLRKKMDDVLDRADEIMREARHRVRNLRRRTADENELPDRLTKWGEELSKDHTATFSLAIVGEPRVLESTVQDEVSRIACEALSNAFRHGSASKIETEVTYDALALRIRVRDDGVGIDPAVLAKGQPGHFGLTGMRERAHALRSELHIWSRDAAGTEVELVVPASIAYSRDKIGAT